MGTDPTADDPGWPWLELLGAVPVLGALVLRFALRRWSRRRAPKCGLT